MGVEYSAEVFFGACVARDTPIGRKLEAYIDKAGGAPAVTEVEGVVVSEVGAQSTGETWMVACIADVGHSFGKNEDVEAPALLQEESTWRRALLDFCVQIGWSPKDVGWHFAGSVY